LVKTGQAYGSPLRLVETTVAVNAERKQAMGRKVIAACGGDVAGLTIGLLGLTFKPDTDDMRESPALDIVHALQQAGARIRAYDPQGIETARALLPGIDFAGDAYAAAADADCLVLVTEWNAFRSLDLERLGRAMARRIFVDLRNVYRRGEVEAHGFAYHAVGRPAGLAAAAFEAAE
jgi:UDPglucose 6-dehydrogenase